MVLTGIQLKNKNNEVWVVNVIGSWPVNLQDSRSPTHILPNGRIKRKTCPTGGKHWLATREEPHLPNFVLKDRVTGLKLMRSILILLNLDQGVHSLISLCH